MKINFYVHITGLSFISVFVVNFRVEGPLSSLGWKRTTDKYDERFKLKWVECKSKINYGAFKEGMLTKITHLLQLLFRRSDPSTV